jgi:hypothetical protein
MRKNLNVLTTLCLGASVALIGCGEEVKKEKTPAGAVKEKPVQEVVPETKEVYDAQVLYQVPTPNELFSVLKELDLPFNASLMNPVENAESYDNTVSQSLNLGVYFADMAMDGNFNDGKNTAEYIKAVLRLGEALNITGAFDKAILDKLTSGGNPEEMASLSSETYFDAYSYLEENQRGAALSMIIIGGWVESVYLMSNSGEFVEGSEFSKRIADQKLTMENLMGFLMKYQDDEDVLSIMEEMIPLDEFFMTLEPIEGEVISTTEEDGVYVLTGGAETVMSSADFTVLKTLVSDLRNSIINADM